MIRANRGGREANADAQGAWRRGDALSTRGLDQIRSASGGGPAAWGGAAAFRWRGGGVLEDGSLDLRRPVRRQVLVLARCTPGWAAPGTRPAGCFGLWSSRERPHSAPASVSQPAALTPRFGRSACAAVCRRSRRWPRRARWRRASRRRRRGRRPRAIAAGRHRSRQWPYRSSSRPARHRRPLRRLARQLSARCYNAQPTCIFWRNA